MFSELNTAFVHRPPAPGKAPSCSLLQLTDIGAQVLTRATHIPGHRWALAPAHSPLRLKSQRLSKRCELAAGGKKTGLGTGKADSPGPSRAAIKAAFPGGLQLQGGENHQGCSVNLPSPSWDQEQWRDVTKGSHSPLRTSHGGGGVPGQWGQGGCHQLIK